MVSKDTKFLVNGKPMTNEQYVELLKTAREAQSAYKSTPEYKKDQEQKQHLVEVREKHTKDFIEFGRKKGLTNEEIGAIGLKLYQNSKLE